MFYEIKYQTGELRQVAEDVIVGKIPKLEVISLDEVTWCNQQLVSYGLTVNNDCPADPNAIDKVKNPDFEFRLCYNYTANNQSQIGFIDYFLESEPDPTYASIAEM